MPQNVLPPRTIPTDTSPDLPMQPPPSKIYSGDLLAHLGDLQQIVSGITGRVVKLEGESIGIPYIIL